MSICFKSELDERVDSSCSRSELDEPTYILVTFFEPEILYAIAFPHQEEDPVAILREDLKLFPRLD